MRTEMLKADIRELSGVQVRSNKGLNWSSGNAVGEQGTDQEPLLKQKCWQDVGDPLGMGIGKELEDDLKVPFWVPVQTAIPGTRVENIGRKRGTDLDACIWEMLIKKVLPEAIVQGIQFSFLILPMRKPSILPNILLVLMPVENIHCLVVHAESIYIILITK